ncbi:hypothetical protein Ptr902_03983 [Pyrenophora tritici-repentis]|nr:hypothetical protein Ptr902_03983 [Pyrenophora tritici-repentis]
MRALDSSRVLSTGVAYGSHYLVTENGVLDASSLPWLLAPTTKAISIATAMSASITQADQTPGDHVTTALRKNGPKEANSCAQAFDGQGDSRSESNHLRRHSSNSSWQTLQNLGFTNPLRTVNNSTRDEGELISDMTPTDANVGKPTSIRESIATAMSSMHLPGPKPKRSASNELLKIDDLENYQQACTEYKQALKEGWSKERLLELVDAWQKIDGGGGRKG